MLKCHQMNRVVVKLRIDQERFSNLVTLDGPQHGPDRIAEYVAGCAIQTDPMVGSGLEKLSGFVDGFREGLFAVDMLCGVQRLQADLKVRTNAREVNDRFHARVSQQLLKGCVHVGTVVLSDRLGAFLIDIEHTFDVDLRMTHPGPHVNVEDKTTAYKCDIQMPTPKLNPNERS